MAAIRELQIGDSFGNYVLERKLGQGGWGEVWLARHARLSYKAPVAIKFVLRPRPKELERFEREVAILDRLRENPHIIKAEDYGQQDGIPYLVMEYAPGGDLTSRLRQGVALDKIGDYLTQAANGLDYAHQFNIIHRDLKPSNILFSADDSLLLADFGIAHEDSFELTESGVGMGTPEYMSPEQFNDAKHVGTTADIYSLGVIVFQMLCRKLPFGSRKEGRSLYEVMTGHVATPVPRLNDFDPNVPTALQHVVEKALAKEPEQRYQSAQEFATAFRAVLAEAAPTEVFKVSDGLPQAQFPASTPPAPVSTPSAPLSPPPLSSPPILPESLATPAPGTFGQTPGSISYTPASTPIPKGQRNLIIGSIAALVVLVIALGAILTLILLNQSDNKKISDPATIAANSNKSSTVTVVSSPGATVTPKVNSTTPAAEEARIAFTQTSASSEAATSNLAVTNSGTTTPALANNPPPGYPTIKNYPTLKKIEISATASEQFKKLLVGTGATLDKFEGYIVASPPQGEGAKIKAFYKSELDKTGWQDITTLSAAITGNKELVAQLELVGGFYLVYNDGNKLAISVIALPGLIAKTFGFPDVDTKDFVVLLAYVSQGGS